MLRRLTQILPVTLALQLVVVGDCWADGESSAVADALFREGRAALLRGDYADAVAKLAESQRVEPTPGTLVNLALAEEKLGRLAASWEHARAVLDQLNPSDDRRPPAAELFERLERRLPRLTLQLRGPAPAGLQIERNGIVLGPAALGTALPVDPGQQRIVVKADGRSEAVYTVTLAEGGRETVLVEPGAPIVPQPKQEGGRRASHPLPTAGTAMLIGGGAVLVTGAVFGLLAVDRKGTVDSDCDANGCGAAGLAAASEGRTFATVSTIGVIAGAAVAAVGLTFVIFPPTKAMTANISVAGSSSRFTLVF